MAAVLMVRRQMGSKWTNFAYIPESSVPGKLNDWAILTLSYPSLKKNPRILIRPSATWLLTTTSTDMIQDTNKPWPQLLKNDKI